MRVPYGGEPRAEQLWRIASVEERESHGLVMMILPLAPWLGILSQCFHDTLLRSLPLA
jgi:hypothetical protein